ncbi:MAG: NlpC/P60 family protein [Bacteroidota bacterium]
MINLAREASIPVREGAAESAEMGTQMLFGESCECLEDQGNWWRVRLSLDGYEGWLNPSMLIQIPERIISTIHIWGFVHSGHIQLGDKTMMRLPRGSRFPIGADGKPMGFAFEGQSWEPADDLRMMSPMTPEDRVEVAKGYLNTPYLWGGRSDFGIDCSGLSQNVYRICGMNIPRDSSVQGRFGEEIAFSERQVGDLAFFRKENSDRISHVGMLSTMHNLIHASGKVRIDDFSEAGIIHSQQKKITHHLVCIRRYLTSIK